MNFDSQWDEIAELIVPNSLRFQSIDTPGEKQMEKVFDSTPIASNARFAAAMQSMLTPATERWHKLVPVDATLEDTHEVRAWCDEANDVLFHMRYDPRTMFGQAIAEAFVAFGAWGNAIINIEEKKGEHLVYRAGHPREYFYVENEWGSIDSTHRKFELTAEQAVGLFGTEVPDHIQQQATRMPDMRFEFLHVVSPNNRQTYQETGIRLPFVSCYVSLYGKRIVRKGGYRTFPNALARYSTNAGEVYGRGPGSTALPDVKMLNEAMKSHIRVAQRSAAPAWLLPEDSIMAALNFRSDALNWGGVDRQGRPLVVPLETNAKIELTFEFLQDVRNRIEQIFHVDLFRILHEKPAGMTATEALIRDQEKGALLAPVGLRAQGEFIGPLIMRELDIALVAGQLPPLPDALLQRGGVGAIKVMHQAPVNQFQKAQKGVSIQNYLSSAIALQPIAPDIVDGINFDEVNREMHDISGAPQKILRTPDEIRKIREDKQAAIDAQAALAAAEQSGKAAKDWSQAQANAANVPTTTLPLLQ
jgi:hypothetical protein